MSSPDNDGAGGAAAFPDGWPDGCPPSDAVLAFGTVFRVVKNDPPTAEDLKTWWELKKATSEARLCEAAGISVFRDVSDAAGYAAKYPYLGDLVALGTLSSEHGRIKPTPRNGNSHVTWWAYEGVIAHTLFVVQKD